MTNVTVGHYSEEEFAKVTPENKGNRTPRWEAEPNYGLRRAPALRLPARCRRAAAVNFPGGDGRRKLGEGLEGLPIVKPPYGVLSAIDLKNPDKLLFQVPHGDTPDNIKNHPLLKGMNIPKTGQSGSVGVLITKTFVASGDPGVTTVNGVRGASLRAYDKMTGAQIGEVRVPAPILGMPMTYSVNGRQYIVVGVSGGNYTGEYIAFTLPASELPRPNTAPSVSTTRRNSTSRRDGLERVRPFFFLLYTFSMRAQLGYRMPIASLRARPLGIAVGAIAAAIICASCSRRGSAPTSRSRRCSPRSRSWCGTPDGRRRCSPRSAAGPRPASCFAAASTTSAA